MARVSEVAHEKLFLARSLFPWPTVLQYEEYICTYTVHKGVYIVYDHYQMMLLANNYFIQTRSGEKLLSSSSSSSSSNSNSNNNNNNNHVIVISARNWPVHHTRTSLCYWVSYPHLSIYTISIQMFLFFWWYSLLSLLRSIPALLNFHFEHWL
jgi:hypothetical protein